VKGARGFVVTLGLALTAATVCACGPNDPSVAVKTTDPVPTRTAAARPFNVVVLGDSIAAGEGATSISARWWMRAQTSLRAALPQRSIVFNSYAMSGTGMDYLERSSSTVNELAYQAAVIIEGRNDDIDDASWMPRYAAVIARLEGKGLLVMIGTYPPDLRAGAFALIARNGAIRTVAGATRPVLDFEKRWLQASPAEAAPWYSGDGHPSDAGQAVEAEVAHAVVLIAAR
jgi:hypothetical protein